MEQLLAEGKEIVVIGYHLNDSYTNDFSEARAEYYGMVGLPHVMIDGVQSFGYSYDDILARYEEQIATSSHYSISIDATRNGTLVNASINVGQIGAPSPGTKVLHLVLTESNIPESWYGGEFVDHAERLMIPDHNGTPLQSGKGIKSNFDFEFEIDPSWSVQSAELVAFLQDTITKEVVQAQVFLMEETVLTNDLVVNEIVFPKTDYCNDVVEPIIRLGNYGVDTLLNCEIEYTLNGETHSTSWEGSLGMFESELVILPEVSFSLDESNTILVEASQPNGQNDENPDNNSASNTFGISQTISDQNLILVLKTDNFGNETSWDIKNSLGEIVHEGSGYADTTTYQFDLGFTTDDCYLFTIYDSAGNGICCETGAGYYSLKDSNGLTYFVGGNFESHAMAMFQLDFETSEKENPFQDEVLIYPNPVTDKLYVENVLNSAISIYDEIGTMMLENKVNSKSVLLDIESLEPGIYFLYVKKENYSIVKKVIVIR